MFKGKQILAIIPARGGSKAVPRKNIKKLGGRPLIAYTIKEAKNSRYIDRVVVSTDDTGIAKVAKRYGAEPPFLRPAELARDKSSSLSVLLHAIHYLEKKENYFADIIVFLQPTSPFRKAKHIDEGIEKIDDSDAVIGISIVREHPYLVLEQKDEFLEPFVKMDRRPLRRQDFPKCYYENASLYITKREYYDKAKDPDPVVPIFKGKVKGVFLDESEAIDIDTPFDFRLAQVVALCEAKYEESIS